MVPAHSRSAPIAIRCPAFARIPDGYTKTTCFSVSADSGTMVMHMLRKRLAAVRLWCLRKEATSHFRTNVIFGSVRTHDWRKRCCTTIFTTIPPPE